MVPATAATISATRVISRRSAGGCWWWCRSRTSTGRRRLGSPLRVAIATSNDPSEPPRLTMTAVRAGAVASSSSLLLVDGQRGRGPVVVTTSATSTTPSTEANRRRPKRGGASPLSPNPADSPTAARRPASEAAGGGREVDGCDHLLIESGEQVLPQRERARAADDDADDREQRRRAEHEAPLKRPAGRADDGRHVLSLAFLLCRAYEPHRNRLRPRRAS